mmetsp:Transcript_66/g.87  ORF Transcript_66/g.87 Transcript_66/m.87 type:complete len:216 (-) Transcript_66:136-783(-)
MGARGAHAALALASRSLAGGNQTESTSLCDACHEQCHGCLGHCGCASIGMLRRQRDVCEESLPGTAPHHGLCHRHHRRRRPCSLSRLRCAPANDSRGPHTLRQTGGQSVCMGEHARRLGSFGGGTLYLRLADLPGPAPHWPLPTAQRGLPERPHPRASLAPGDLVRVRGCRLAVALPRQSTERVPRDSGGEGGDCHEDCTALNGSALWHCCSSPH